MEAKLIRQGSESRSRVVAGVVKAVDAIKTTLGPSGRCVAIDMGFGPEISRDGATVAKSIKLSDPEMNIGAEMVKKAASSTEEQCGDATSSTSVLIKELCLRGEREVLQGANVNELKSGMLKASEWVKSYVRSYSTPVGDDLEKIRRVAAISANNDPTVGDLIVQGMKAVGVSGLITADMTSGLDTVIEVTQGMKIDRGWSSPQYVTNPEEGTCVLEDPYVLVLGEKISSINQVVGLLEDIQTKIQGKPFLIICDDIDENVNTMFVLNTLRGALRCCVIKGVDFGDGRKNVMADIAAVVGAKYITPDTGSSITEAKVEDLGRAKKAVVYRDRTIIYEGNGDSEEVNQRADILRRLLSRPETSDYDRMKFENRLAGLTGGIAIIRAGGASETEKQNKKATIEDAILASKSAIEEGYVPGGGYVFWRASMEILKDKSFWKELEGNEVDGAKIVASSLPVILSTVASNSGVSADVVLDNLKKQKEGIGYNAKTKKLGNLVEEGVLDSAKVLRVSLENAVSAASMILMIDCTITDEPTTTDETKSCGCGH